MIERMHARSGPTSYLRVGSLRCCNPLYAFARDCAHVPGLHLWSLSELCSLASMNAPALPGRCWQEIEVSSESCRRGPVLRPYSLVPDGGRFSGCSLEAEDLRRGIKMRLDRVPGLPTSPEIRG
jgi:hypothetical protein